jgi:predicted  nucleic acid-binding Zn-ribbon protein
LKAFWKALTPTLAAWIQAIGVIGSLWVVLYFSRRNEVRKREAELHRAKGVVTQLKAVLEQFRLKLAQVEAAPFKKKKIWLPTKMMQRSRDFHLLGHLGTNLDLLVEQLASLNNSMAALPTEQPFDPEQRLQAEADIKEGLSSCRQLLESVLEEMKEIELSAKKPFVVRRIIDTTQRFFGNNPSV